MFSPNKWVRVFSIFPGFLIIAFLLFEGIIFSIYFIPSLQYTTFIQTLFNYIHFIIFLWMYIVCWWSYIACAFTHPGPVTDEYLHDYQEQYGRSDVRYCYKCDQFKPPRCHHCSICRMCVVNMDHHCPWLCNCIGYQNKKYFILFLSYAFIGCIDIVICCIRSIHLSPTRFSYYSVYAYRPLTFLCGTIAGTYAFTLLFFGGFHVWMVFNDRTTIEMNTYCRNIFHHTIPTSHCKTSAYENWCMVMDKQWYLWFVPVHSKDFKFQWTFLDNDEEDGYHGEHPMYRQEETQRLLNRMNVDDIPRV